MSKWIDFVKVSETDKTSVFNIVPKENQTSIIGQVKWYGPWRKYSFFPNPNCIFETQCLRDIISFIDNLMLQRKIKKQQA